MTRDLFNLFVFLEIVSIATYGLLGLRDTPAALSATFKFLMATVLASTFFLIGTVLLYAATGLLNIDDLIANRDAISGPIGFAALIFLLACLLLELKPFPANGWGLDVYETARSDVAAIISGGVSAGVFYALLKLLPLFEDQLEAHRCARCGDVCRVEPHWSSADESATPPWLFLGWPGCAADHCAFLALRDGCRKIRFSWSSAVFSSITCSPKSDSSGLPVMSGRSACRTGRFLLQSLAQLFLFGTLIVAISGLPPFPGFWAKWQLIMTLASGERYVWIAILLVGSLLEAAYMFRWLGLALHSSAGTAKTAGRPRDLLACRRDGFAARGQRLYRCRPGRVHRALDVFAGLCRTRRVAAQSAAWPGTGSHRARFRAGRKPLAHFRFVGPQPSVCCCPGRRRPCRFDRLPQSRRPTSGFLPFSDHPAAFIGRAAARRYEPRVHFRVGADHAVVLFPGSTKSRSGGLRASIFAVLACRGLFPVMWICGAASADRQCVSFGLAPGRSG